MPRPLQPPSYQSYSKDGVKYARTCYTDIDGTRKSRSLGIYGSPESWERHERIVTQWRAQQEALTTGAIQQPVTGEPLTVEELVARFLVHAERHYRHADGRLTAEYTDYRHTLRPLVRIYGGTQASDFGPLKLKALRQAIVTGSWLTDTERKNRSPAKRTVCRRVANQRTNRIRRMFKWAASEELLPASVYHALQTVQGLQSGRTEARDYPDVPPVADAVVEATLPHLHAVGRAMVQLQRLTGMRPGEVVAVKPAEIDREGLVVDGVRVWIYRPAHHKTAWRGHSKATAIGPQAQAVLFPFLDRDPAAYCFDPREAPLAYRTRRDRYTTCSYGRLIARACQRAGVEPWHPNQLRHSMGTQVGVEFGLDAARTVLGHIDPKVTTIYAARDLREAARVVAKIG